MPANRYTLTALTAAVCLALAACGGETVITPSKFERKDYKRIVVGNAVEPGSLDPQKSGDMAAGALIRQMMDGLVGSDAAGKTVPALAEKWESDGDKVWTFHLRDAKWSNGEPITADDFVYSFRRLTDPETGAPYASYLADGKVVNAEEVMLGKAKPETLGVKALDKKTLQFTLTAPVPYFPDMLIQQFTYPVHRATVEKFGDKWTQPENYVSSGAYKLKEWRVNSHIALEKNPAYYDADKVTIPEATFLSTGKEFDRYRADEMDVTYAVPTDQIKTADKEFSGQVKRTTLLCTWYLEPNESVVPFNNPKVRRALNMLIDRDIITKVSGRGDTPAFQMTPPNMQGSEQVAPDWKAWSKEKRTAEALKLLTEAGYSEKNPLTFEVLYSTNESSRKQITALRSIWKTAVPFIQPNLLNQEWKTYQDTRQTGNFAIAFSGWCSDYNEPSGMLNVFRSNNPNNRFFYANPVLDKTLDDTLTAGITPEERVKLYGRAESIIQQDSVILPLYHQVSVQLVKPDIQGFSTEDPMKNYVLKNWSFAPKK